MLATIKSTIVVFIVAAGEIVARVSVVVDRPCAYPPFADGIVEGAVNGTRRFASGLDANFPLPRYAMFNIDGSSLIWWQAPNQKVRLRELWSRNKRTGFLKKVFSRVWHISRL
jgi:hypothetical protein